MSKRLQKLSRSILTKEKKISNNPPKFKQTKKQIEATAVLSSAARSILLMGGSRSGKTFKIIRTIIIRACKTKSKHLIVRKTFNSAKRSIWLATLPKVLRLCFPDLSYTPKNSDFYIVLPNGSEIWIGGLDDKERVEKILGLEFSSIFFNEISQISYSSVNIALTRLSEKNLLIKKAYYDMNPPNTKHWSFRLFVKYENPESGELVDPEDYPSLLMNPKDNEENLDEDYIEKILGQLPPKERDRFEHGLFTDSNEGLVYYCFSRERNVEEFEIDLTAKRVIGTDFNVDPWTSVVAYEKDGKIYIFDEIFLRNSDTYLGADELIRKGFSGADIIPDSTGSARKTAGKSDHVILKEKKFNVKRSRNPAVKDRVNAVNSALKGGVLVIHKSCKNLIKDLEVAAWLEGKAELDKRDHLINQIADALGYLVWYLKPIKFKEDPFTIEL